MDAQKFLGYKAIGELFGVSGATVSKWRTRYAATDHPCPEPTIWIDDVPGWNSPAAWKAWKIGLPGRGIGGGPLPLGQARDEYFAAMRSMQEQFPNSPRQWERRTLAHLADAHGVDYDALTHLAAGIMEKNPELPNDECDIIAVATAIRSARKTKS